MQTKLIIAMSALAIANLAFADDICQRVQGTWSGKGSATSWIIGTCYYHGTGTISPVGGDHFMTINVTGDKDGGSELCPKHFETQLRATCDNGYVVVKTDYGNLNGSANGNTAYANGTISVAGVDADIKMQLWR